VLRISDLHKGIALPKSTCGTGTLPLNISSFADGGNKDHLRTGLKLSTGKRQAGKYPAARPSVLVPVFYSWSATHIALASIVAPCLGLSGHRQCIISDVKIRCKHEECNNGIGGIKVYEHGHLAILPRMPR
jgi:hypothetical protein